MRRRVLVFLAVLVAVVAFSACGARKAKCEKVLDKLVEMAGPMDYRLKAEMMKRLAAQRDADLATCVENVSDKTLDCVLAATDFKELQKCGPGLAALGGNAGPAASGGKPTPGEH